MALILSTDEPNFPKTETLFTQCSHIEFVDTGLGKHAPKMELYVESKCPGCLGASEGAGLPDELAGKILQEFNLRLAQLPLLRHGFTSTVTDNPKTFNIDTSKFNSPPIRIVPSGASILNENNKCSICWGTFDPSPSNIREGCTGGEPVMLPCSHIFGQDCIGGIFASFSKSCPLCTRLYKVRSAKTKYLNQHIFDMIDAQNPGWFLFIVRCLVLLWLYPLFNLVDAFMGCGPETEKPKEFWTTVRNIVTLFSIQLLCLIDLMIWGLVFGLVWVDILLPWTIILLERFNGFLVSLL